MDNYYEQYFTMEKSNYMDLKLLNFGIQQCKPSHSYGPAVRTFHLIHYILNGGGVFEFNKKNYKLTKGQAFLILPRHVTFYAANEKDPWHYAWLAFEGFKLSEYLLKAGLSYDMPIYFPTRENKIYDIISNIINSPQNQIKLAGYSHLFFNELIDSSKNKKHTEEKNIGEKYMESVLNYIAINYHKDIKVTELACLCGLDRSYFSRLFKDYMNVSPQDFILNYKIERAKELMQSNNLSIGDISRSVGYSDPLAFSKIFKKITGRPPSSHRKFL